MIQMSTLYGGRLHRYKYMRRTVSLGGGPPLMHLPVPPPGGRRCIEAAWGPEDCVYAVFRPGLQGVRELERKPDGLINATESMLGMLQPRSSVCYWLTATQRRLELGGTARNADDMNQFSRAFEHAIPCSLTEDPKPLREHPLTARIQEIERNQDVQEHYGLEIREYDCSNAIYMPLVLTTPVSGVSQIVTAVAADLQPGEVVMVSVILFPADPGYWEPMRQLAQQHRAEQQARLRMFATNTYRMDYGDPIDRKMQQPRLLMYYCIRLVYVVRRDRETALDAALRPLFSEYRHGDRSLDIITDWAGFGVAPPAIREAVKNQAPLSSAGLLTIPEIARLIQVPNETILTHAAVHVPLVRASPPISPITDSNQSVVVGVDPENPEREFRLALVDGANFTVSGIPGTGKSTFMLNLAASLLRAGGHGMLLHIPMAELDQLLAPIPAHRRDDVVLIDLTADRVVGIRVMTRESIEAVRSLVRTLALQNAEGVVWGQHIDEFFVYLGLLVTAAPFGENAVPTLEHMRCAAVNPRYRKRLLEQCEDEDVRAYFNGTYKDLARKGRNPSHSIDALLQVFTRGAVGAVLNQLHPKLDMEEVLRDNKTLLLHTGRLSQGRDAANNFGGIIASIGVNAGIKPYRQNDLNRLFWFLLDEAHPYFNDYLADAVVQGRNFGLRFVLGYQTLESFKDSSIRGRILTTPTTFCFRSSPMDARYWQHETGMRPEEIIALSNHEFFLRQGDRTYHLRSRPPLPPATPETIRQIRQQAEAYACDRSVYDQDYYYAILPGARARKR